MKNCIFIFLLVPFIFQAQNLHKKVKVLFLGNSYTYVNNLPLLIHNIALSSGDTLVYDGNTLGGYSFNNHCNDVISLTKINAAAWNFVVLQAQSQEPSFQPSQVNSQTLPYAIRLDSLIKINNICTQTVFYETWGRKNGDQQNCNFYPPLCTYQGMQDRLKQSYKKFADTTNSIMAPAGEACRNVIALSPALELYDPDQSHPSLSGSFLTACIFYEILFQKSVVGNSYNPGITPLALSFLQQAAHNTLNDSLSIWNIGINYPWAAFDPTQVSSSVFQFQSASPALSNKWYFGDGSCGTSALASHNYSGAAAIYTVSHVVSNGCSKDSVSKVIVTNSNGFNSNKKVPSITALYPNPCHSTLHIKLEGTPHNAATIEITNVLGQLVYAGALTEAVQVDDLDNGHYLLKVSDGGAMHYGHFIRN